MSFFTVVVKNVQQSLIRELLEILLAETDLRLQIALGENKSLRITLSSRVS